MAYPSVTQAQHRADDASAKNESGFGETPRRWWQRKTQPVPAVERSTFPRPDAPTQAIPPVPTARPQPATPPRPPKPQVLYRERPSDLDRAVYNLMGLLTVAGREKWSATRIVAEILDGGEPAGIVRGVGEDEKREAMKLLARSGNGAQAAAQIVENLSEIVSAEQKANELPGVTVKAHVATDTLGSELVAVTANQGALSDETTQFQRITPGMPDPRVQVSVTTVTVDKPPSPVHVPGDGLRPAVPDADEELADPGAAKPLPRRVPQASTHPVLPADLGLDPYEAVDPTIEGAGLAPGAWVFDEGTGTGGPVWFLLAEQEDKLRDRGRVAVLKFANDHVREVDAGTQVKVLDVCRAQVLAAQIEQRLAARDAEQEASS